MIWYGGGVKDFNGDHILIWCGGGLKDFNGDHILIWCGGGVKDFTKIETTYSFDVMLEWKTLLK